MAAETRITLEDVSYSFGKGALRKQILFDINTRIEAGQIVILTGPSGSGKTTLLKILAGVLPFENGERTLGHNVITAYYAQYQFELLDPTNTVLAELRIQIQHVVAPW